MPGQRNADSVSPLATGANDIIEQRADQRKRHGDDAQQKSIKAPRACRAMLIAFGQAFRDPPLASSMRAASLLAAFGAVARSSSSIASVAQLRDR